ncbi:transcriptional activator [Deinococcus metallilatus]|nr:transcriptional activator [Deinococcus metallilatus]
MGRAVTTSLRLLGAVWAEQEAHVIPFLPDKRHQLLAYLAYCGDWVDRDHPTFLFWPDSPPQVAGGNFRQLLVRVRALTCAAGLEIERHRLRWPVQTDVAAFLEAVGTGRWAEALAGYGGPLMDRLEGDEPGEFAGWLGCERERLRGLWRTAVLRRAGELTEGGAHLEATELLGQLLEADEFDEAALQAQVGALLRAGGRERARQAYEAFVERLRAELGLEPTAELAQLGRTLSAPAALPEPGATPPRPGPSSGPLPRPTTSFVGRDLELAEIARLLAQPGCRLLTLTGPGGIGKTRLALEAARGLAPRFPDGVFFVPLAPLTSEAQLTARVAAGLGLTPQGQADPLDQLVRWLGDRQVLLVLDNFEHLLEAAGVPQALIRRCPNLRLLVTSRGRLGVEAEWLLPLAGLEYPESLGLGPTPNAYFDAVRLFLERARQVRPDFAPGEEEWPPLLGICQLVAGSPLGLELAAGWVRCLGLADIAREIGENLDFLSAAGSDAAGRHASLRAVFDHSWRLLTPAEGAALRALSVFQGGFRLEAARRVSGASLPVLAALVDKSLLRRSHSGRYDRHALLHQYAREKLAEQPGEQRAARERHGRYYLALLAERSGEIGGPQGQAALAALDEEFGNIRLAWHWGVEEARTGQVWREWRRAAVGGLPYFSLRARYQEGEALYGEAAAALEEAGPEHGAALGEVLIPQASFTMRLGRYEEARYLGERGLALVLPDSQEAITGLGVLGAVEERTGAFSQAERHFGEALVLAERHGRVPDQATLRYNLANVALGLGDYDRAERQVERSVALFAGIGQRLGLVFGLDLQGYVALGRGHLDDAGRVLTRGLALARELGLHQRVPDFLQNLAEVAYERGNLAEARRLAEEGLALAQAEGHQTMEISALALLGRVSAAAGDDRQARGHLRRSIRLAWVSGETPRLLVGLVYLAEWRLRRGEVREAVPLLLAAERHPAAEHRLRALARRLGQNLAGQLVPGELVEAPGDPAGLETLVTRALAGLDLALPTAPGMSQDGAAG